MSQSTSARLKCRDCCKKFSYETYIYHVKQFHKYNKQYVCGVSNCFYTAHNIYNLQKHLKRNHEFTIDNTTQSALYSMVLDEKHVECNVEYPDVSSDVCTSTENVHKEQYGAASINMEQHVASFVAKLYQNPSVTRKVVQEVLESTHELFASYFKNIQYLQSEIPANTNFNSFYSNPLDNFMSEYKRLQYFEESHDLVKPKSFFIGQILDDKRTHKEVSFNFKNSYGQIVSIKKMLTLYLQLPNVFSSIMSYISTETANIASITSVFNCNLWRRIKAKFPEKIVLPLFVYYDDFEPGNPLGTHAGVHKVGAVYFSVGGVPPKYSSLLENIFLWGLFYASDRNVHGNGNVFHKFVLKLQYLENYGIEITHDGSKIRVYFALTFLLGDNLGINSIIGMTESFNSDFFCRKCKCSKAVSESLYEENADLLRSKKCYEEDLTNQCNGIKNKCVWNELTSYNIIENISFDLMHDVFEGICRYDLGAILHNFIKIKKYFTLDTLNLRIKYFDYNDNCDIGNRIPLININHINKMNIIISSAEMSGLITYLGFLIGDLVDQDDDMWNLYLILYDIIHIITKQSTNSSELNYLKHLIKLHNEMYVNLFDLRLKPKHHFLIHYPSCILETGPLCFLSSIRFEAFHKYSKTNAHIVTSRKNIIFTLALRLQFKSMYRFVSKTGFKDCIESGSKSEFVDNIVGLSENLIEAIGKKAVSLSWVKLNGIRYAPNIVVQITRDQFGEPVFGLIQYLIRTHNEDIYFIYYKVPLIGINKHFQGYLVDTTKLNEDVRYKLINLKNIYSVLPAAIHKIATGDKVINVMNQD